MLQLPVVNNDWWETIEDVNENKSVGQVQVLQALGSEEQINTLKTERGFGKDFVTSKFQHVASRTNKNIVCGEASAKQKSVLYKSGVEQCSKDKKLLDKTLVEKRKTVDIGVQSEMATPKRDREVSNKTVDSSEQSVLQKSKNTVDNAAIISEIASKANQNYGERNTADVLQKSPETSKLRRTSDLLNSLQNALSATAPVRKVHRDITDSFRAHVVVENALHLPSRKKCKPKKTKGKNAKKQDDVLPSTYVTFETLTGREVNVTPVVQKSVNPKWDYRCDVALPVELLTNVSFCFFVGGYIF